MLNLEKCFDLARGGYRAFGLRINQGETLDLLEYFQKKCQNSSQVYYANAGKSRFQRLTKRGELLASDISANVENTLEEIIAYKEKAVFLIDDWLTKDLSAKEKRIKEAQIQNFLAAQGIINSEKIVFFLITDYQLSGKISTLVPVLNYSLPKTEEIESILIKKLTRSKRELLRKISPLKVTKSLLGLSRGEIRYAIDLFMNSNESLENVAYKYKISRFRKMGLEFIAEPDVEMAGGLDLLQGYLKKISQLYSSSAEKYDLSPPKGMLLAGVPGTGKTLCAKLAAFQLGYALMGLSWSNILGADNSDRALSQILEIADTIDRVVLLADDFDKGFTGWNEGGVSMRLSQKLLTWMSEHQSNVLMIATVNRIGLLPAELKRRFDDGGIWFVDLPTLGEMHSIFKIYLQKYFPEQYARTNHLMFSDREWYKLLKEYSGATPVEIKNAVIRCATEKYCALTELEKNKRVPYFVTLEDLLAQLKQFVKSIDRDSEDIRAIRNSSQIFKRASSPDNSIFVREERSMYDYELHELETA